MFVSTLLRTKAINADHGACEITLRRVLGPVDLTLLGIGAIVGAGIFVLTGVAAATQAGPAIVLSYLVRGRPAPSARWPTPSWPRPSAAAAAPTVTATRAWERSSPGSSAGT